MKEIYNPKLEFGFGIKYAFMKLKSPREEDKREAIEMYKIIKKDYQVLKEKGENTPFHLDELNNLEKELGLRITK